MSNTTTTRPANMVMTAEEAMAATLLALKAKCESHKVVVKS